MQIKRFIVFILYLVLYSACTKRSYHSYSYRDVNNNVIKGSRKNVVDKSIPSDGSMTIIGKNNIIETHISNALILGGGFSGNLVIIADSIHHITKIDGGVIGGIPFGKNSTDTIRYKSGTKEEINIKGKPYLEKKEQALKHEEKAYIPTYNSEEEFIDEEYRANFMDSILRNEKVILKNLENFVYEKETKVFLDYFQKTVTLKYALNHFIGNIKAGKSEYYYEIAQMYFYGVGLPMSKAKALSLYQQSAIMGHLESIKQAGDIYWNGASDVKIDKKKAIYFYDLGSQLNDHHCQEMLKRVKKN